MSANDEVSNAIDPSDPVFQYLTGPPPPRSSIGQSDIRNALAQLEEAARLATVPEAGKRWVPALAIVVVVRENDTCRILYCGGHGPTSVGSAAPVGPDTLFPCASLSKPVATTLLTAAGVRERPGWERVVLQPNAVDTYHLANSPAPSTTLRQWLSHRSGMPDHGGDLIEDMNPGMTRHDLIGRIMKYQTDIEPGQFRYTNFGFTIGCIGAANALGHTDWEDFSEHWLINLGMSRSTYKFTSAFDGEADRVFPHQGKPALPDLLNLQPTGWTWRVVDREHERNPARQAPAGSLLSSAHDLGQFLRALLSRQFGDFPPRNPPPEDTQGGKSYSLGWNVANHSGQDAFKRFGQPALNEISFSHTGAFVLGAGTCLRFDPDAGFGIAILSNGEPTGVPETLAQLFFKYLYGQLMPAGCDHARLLALGRMLMMGALHDQALANYRRYHGKTTAIPDSVPQGEVFRGRSHYYGCDIVIERVGRDLFLVMGVGPQGGPFWRFPLQCLDTDDWTFVYETTGENGIGLSAIRLARQGNLVVRIVDDWLNGTRPDLPGTGLGVIERLKPEPAG